MNIHVCKQCGSRFEYCRKCVFRPVRYKDAGFCSKECYEASKNKVEPIEDKIVETTLVEEVVSSDVKIEESVEEISSEPETITESPVVETVAKEPTYRNETNTYKNKKNKYKYTSSY